MFRTTKIKFFEFFQWIGLCPRLVVKKILRYRDATTIACCAATEYLAIKEPNKHFSPLTPVLLEGEHYLRYEKELAHALNNSEVLNIAITGKYGAGKSSILKTYVNRNKHLKYAWISLATFASKDEISQELNQDSIRVEPGKDVSGMINRIEETIVQQLLYSVPTKKLPKTRLKRIYQAKKCLIIFFTFASFCWCVMAVRQYQSSIVWPDNFTPPESLKLLNFIPMSLAEGVLIVGMIFALYKFVQLALSIKIDGLTVKGGKIEITNTGSLLHKNIDEIIYCFEQSNIDVVLIEDLDRFEITDVFYRLREINFIIKNSPQIKRPIHFVYALRDEFFAVSEKTKFFDAIIPVIPVVNTDNSKAQMRQLLSKRKPWDSEDADKNLLTNLNPKLVDAISNYIDDMRVIKNIVNEYDINVHILAEHIQLNRSKLFGIIAIRNLYPVAYAGLMRRKGEIYGVFKHFEEWRKNRADAIAKEIEHAKESLEAQTNMIGGSIEELRALVWLEIMKQCGGSRAVAVGLNQNDWVTITDFIKDDIFKKYMAPEGRLNTYSLHNGYPNLVGNTVISKTILNAKTANGLSYNQCISLIDQGINTRKETLKKLEGDHQAQIRLSFRNAESDPYFAKSITAYCTEKNLGALSYLIRHGHFADDYIDYVGYFYQGSLSLNDKKVTMAVREGRTIEVDSKIDDPEIVLDVLSEEGLSGGRGLNIKIINFLCSKSEKDRQQNMKDILFDADKHINRLADVIDGLWENSSLQPFITDIFSYNHPCLWQLSGSDKFTKIADLNQKFITEVFDTLSTQEIEKLTLDEQQKLLAPISKLADVSLLIEKFEASEKGWKWLREYPVRFQGLGDSTPAKIIEKLLAWDCIRLNLDMLKLIINTGRNSGEEKNLNLTIAELLQLPFPNIKNILKSQIALVGAELTKQEGKLAETNDSLKLFISFLFEVDEEEVIDRLLKKTDVSFANLEDVPDYLWSQIFASNRIIPTAPCVYEYCAKHSIYDEDVHDDENDDFPAQNALNSYITLHASALGRLLWLENEPHSTALKTYILKQKTLDDTTVSLLLAQAHIDKGSCLPEDMDSERWNILIEKGILTFNSEIQSAVQDAVPNLYSKFLILSWDTAKSIVNLGSLSLPVIVDLSKSGVLSTQEKIDIWSGVDFKAIDQAPEAIKQILAVCKAANEFQLFFKAESLELLNTAVMDDKVDFELRVEGIIQLLPHINRVTACEVFNEIKENGWDKFPYGRGKISVTKNALNLRLMNSLNHRGFVGPVSEIDEKIVAHGTLKE